MKVRWLGPLFVLAVYKLFQSFGMLHEVLPKVYLVMALVFIVCGIVFEYKHEAREKAGRE